MLIVVVLYFIFFFFFFKQKTAYEMRISDWSSDVCSSDLRFPFEGPRRVARDFMAENEIGRAADHGEEGGGNGEASQRYAKREVHACGLAMWVDRKSVV